MEHVLKIIFLYVTVVSGSRCPEARKPHVTSCTVFYECINLPEGGYVWAPMKCPDGLMFQPSLRLCVLPGDSWTCTEPEATSPIDPQATNIPELIDQTKTSYYGLNQNSNSNGLVNLANLFPIMPYPLIEIEKSKNNEKQEDSLEPDKKVSVSLNVLDKKIEKIPLKNRLVFYKNYKRPLIQTVLISPVINSSTNEFYVQFIRNFFYNKTINRMKNHEITTTNQPIIETSVIDPEIRFNLTDEANNVIAIHGNLGNKEYVTIEKYKLLASQRNIEPIEVIACTTGIRLANATNCMKYYTCEPKTAEIHEFTCPHNTAFNGQINLCDTKKYKSCRRKLESFKAQQKFISISPSEMENSNPCEKPGKFPDKLSEKFYYLCFVGGKSEGLEFVRLACPNRLIFCDKRKLCLSKRLCTESE